VAEDYAERYRREAERCRQRAQEAPTADTRRQWEELAAEFDKLAETVRRGMP